MASHRIPALLQQAEPGDPWGKLFSRSLKLVFEEHAHHRDRLRVLEEAVLDLAEIVRGVAKEDADRIAAHQRKIRDAYAAYEAQSAHWLDMMEDLANAASLAMAENDRRKAAEGQAEPE